MKIKWSKLSFKNVLLIGSGIIATGLWIFFAENILVSEKKSDFWEPKIEDLLDSNICQPTDITPYDYAQALCMSLLFYEAQRSGKLPAEQRVKWRGDSALDDGSDNNVDLSGGYYDAGDYVKFGFPMAFTISTLAWGIILYPNGYKIAGELENARTAVRWGAEYLLKANTDLNELWVQVGDPKIDHLSWTRPEEMKMFRPSFKINSSHPGSDVAAETAAALAATYIIFKDLDSEFSYHALKAAKNLFEFADNYRGLYQNSVEKAKGFYDSNSFGDELAWNALWLYKATEDKYYMEKAKKFMNEFQIILNYTKAISWDSKHPGVYALLLELDGDLKYRKELENYLNRLIYEEKHTPKGLLYVSKWGTIRAAMGSAFIAMRAVGLGLNPTIYQEWAQKQADYALGSTGRSFVVGFGQNPPVRPHHKAASCPDPHLVCDFSYLSSSKPNPKIIIGALVGGPNQDDEYTDYRRDFVHNEVSCDYNSLFTGLLASMVEISCEFSSNCFPFFY